MDQSGLIHKNIMDDDKWIRMPLNMQMGNIGAEISRLTHWKRKGNQRNVDASWERALELIDLTVYGLIKTDKSYRMRELLILRELLCDYAGDFGEYHTDGEVLADYCTEYMLQS